MSLELTINSDIKQAMLNKDTKKLEALRAIKAAVLLAKTGKDVSSAGISKEQEISILKRLIKQRKESATIYAEKGREEMAAEEIYQAEIIEQYLPEQMTEQEVEKVVVEIINEVGAESMKDMGKVMGIVIKKLAGQADNKMISSMVREKLQPNN
jgi:uncharacterized protein YqeY